MHPADGQELINQTLASYQAMGDIIARTAQSASHLKESEARIELHEIVIGLITRIISADDKLKPAESDLLTALWTTRNAPVESLELVKVYQPKWPRLLNHVPNFIVMAAAQDKINGSRNAANLVSHLQTIGLHASTVDADQQSSEQEALAAYLGLLEAFLAEPQGQSTARMPGQPLAAEIKVRVVTPPPLPDPPCPKIPGVDDGQAPPVMNSGNRTPADAGPSSPRLAETAFTQLDRLVGLKMVKHEVRTLINLIRIRKRRAAFGLPNPTMSLHLVFSGNPGTGKTTVARLLAEIYRSLSVLPKGHLIETDRAGLVGGYVGQTALKVNGVVERARGGFLFIDEAYSLSQTGAEVDFGREAVDALLKLMEDHRNELVVVVAGYTNKMAEFLRSNPGLESRFNRSIYFEDYLPAELYEIFMKLCEAGGYTYGADFARAIAIQLRQQYEQRAANWGNARAARNLFETVIANQANRLGSRSYPTWEELITLNVNDLPVSPSQR